MKTFEQFESSFSKATCKLCNNEATAFNDGFCYQHTQKSTTQHDAQCKGCGGVNCKASQPNSEEKCEKCHGLKIPNDGQFLCNCDCHSPKPEENECICKNLVMPSCPIHGVKLKTNLHTPDEYAHETKDGYCCACDYDIACMEDKISTAIKTREEEIALELEKTYNKCRTDRLARAEALVEFYQKNFIWNEILHKYEPKE